jgi:hypothetical protein
MMQYSDRLGWRTNRPETLAGREITPDITMRALAFGDEPGMTQRHEAELLFVMGTAYAAGQISTEDLLMTSLLTLRPGMHAACDRIMKEAERCKMEIDRLCARAESRMQTSMDTITHELFLRYDEIEREAHERLDALL